MKGPKTEHSSARAEQQKKQADITQRAFVVKLAMPRGATGETGRWGQMH